MCITNLLHTTQSTGMADPQPASMLPKTLILGLGKTGLSCAKFLTARGFDVTVADTRANPPGLDSLTRDLPMVQVKLGEFKPQLIDDIQQIVISPGLSTNLSIAQQAQAKGLPIWGDIELFAQALRTLPEYHQGKIIAVTGSNGKSTVVGLLGAMAQAAGGAICSWR